MDVHELLDQARKVELEFERQRAGTARQRSAPRVTIDLHLAAVQRHPCAVGLSQRAKIDGSGDEARVREAALFHLVYSS